MSTSSNNPAVVLLRERASDLASYLEIWKRRDVMTDRRAARSSARMAIERAAAIAQQMSTLATQLLEEIDAYDDQRSPGSVDQDHAGATWTDTGSGAGYSSGQPISMPEGGVYDSNADGTVTSEPHDPRD